MRMATLGIPQTESFRKDNKISVHLETAAATLAQLLDKFDMVCMNEFSAVFRRLPSRTSCL